MKLKNIMINPNIEFACENTPAVNVPLQKLEGQWFVVVSAWNGVPMPGEPDAPVDADSVASPVGSAPNQQPASGRSLISFKSQDPKEQLFRIQVFHRGTEECGKQQPKKTFTRSYSDIVIFHSVMSECVVDLIHQGLDLR